MNSFPAIDGHRRQRFIFTGLAGSEWALKKGKLNTTVRVANGTETQQRGGETFQGRPTQTERRPGGGENTSASQHAHVRSHSTHLETDAWLEEVVQGRYMHARGPGYTHAKGVHKHQGVQ